MVLFVPSPGCWIRIDCTLVLGALHVMLCGFADSDVVWIVGLQLTASVLAWLCLIRVYACVTDG